MERNFSPLLLLARALRPPVLRAWLAGLALILAAATAQAELRGAVAATGWRDGVPLVSPPASFRIGLAARRPALSLHAESLAAAFSREGEAVRLRIAARNDGNVTLASPVIEVQ